MLPPSPQKETPVKHSRTPDETNRGFLVFQPAPLLFPKVIIVR